MVGVGVGGGLPCWDCSTCSDVPERRGNEMPFLFPKGRDSGLGGAIPWAGGHLSWPQPPKKKSFWLSSSSG